MSLLLPALVLLLWEYISAFSPLAPGLHNALPPPTAVAVSAWHLIQNGELAADMGISILRVLGGFAIAAALAIPIGFGMGLSPIFDDFTDPIVEMLRPIPPPAWIPLGILWFGIGNAQNIFILSLGVFFPTVLNTIAGVRSVDRTLVWAMLTLGGNRRDVLREIVIPAAIPLIITGLRIGLGVGWGALIAAELLAARSGLGFLIASSRYAFDTARMMTGMLAIGLIGFAMDFAMRALQRRVVTH
ncbi:MAG: ABC transporter permease [Candidatus Eremiobacteraeota bacterium]|nr:ABC transporter permease [Candidatus Eremiobacteraeota bacterium]